MSEQWSYSVTDGELEDLIRAYCTDFTALARQGRYGPITGRDQELSEVILILLQKGRKNAVLLAPAGVGKTALVVALAQKIAEQDVPDYLKNARVIEVDLARMAAGTNGPAEFQERFIPLCKAVAERYHNPKNPRIIMFLDEIHQIMPNFTASAYKGLSDVMKPYLTAGDLMVIGATTLDEFRMYVTADPALDRRFQKVFLKVPDDVETYRILKSILPGMQKHHGVSADNLSLMMIVQLTAEHMRKRNQPDKSIITLDSAMAYHVRENGRDTKLTFESIYYMMGRETGLNKQALHDEKKVQRIMEQVLEIEREQDIYYI
jgi:ATP-dependent Clp protease ATP-binding subunit ClpA